MLVRRLSQLVATATLAVTFVAFTAVVGVSVAKKRDHHHDRYIGSSVIHSLSLAQTNNCRAIIGNHIRHLKSSSNVQFRVATNGLNPPNRFGGFVGYAEGYVELGGANTLILPAMRMRFSDRNDFSHSQTSNVRLEIQRTKINPAFGEPLTVRPEELLKGEQLQIENQVHLQSSWEGQRFEPLTMIGCTADGAGSYIIAEQSGNGNGKSILTITLRNVGAR